MPRLPLPADFTLAPPAPVAGRAPSRCLFAFDAEGAPRLRSRAGASGTFARASAGTFVDSCGGVRIASTGQPRWYACDLDGDGAREAVGLLLERPSRNLAPYHTPTAAHWGYTNATVTPAWQTVGDIALSRISADTAAYADAYLAVLRADDTGTPCFSGASGPRAVSCIVAPSPTPMVGGPALSLYDTTANQARLFASYTFDAAGAPVVVASTGTYLGAEPLGGGAWRLGFLSTAVTVANYHLVVACPAQGTNALGDMVFGGVQVEDAPMPTSLIPTDAGVTAARTVETLTFPLAFAPQDLTLVAELARPWWVGLTGGGPYYHAPIAVGAIGGGGGLLLHDAATGIPGATRYDGVVADAATTFAGGVRGPFRERLAWAGQFSGWRDRRTAPAVTALTDGGVGSAVQPAGTVPAPSFGDLHIRLHGWDDTGIYAPDAVLLAAKIAPGIRSLDEMRGLR